MRAAVVSMHPAPRPMPKPTRDTRARPAARRSPRSKSADRPGLLTRLVTGVRLALFGHLRLKRQGHGLRVAFGETLLHPPVEAPAPASVQGGAVAPAFSDSELAMQAALGSALGAQRSLRKALRQLAYVEDRVKRRGFASLGDVPVDVLERAYRQLSLVAAGGQASALVPFEARLSAALVARGVRKHLLDEGSPHDFLERAKPVVSDARLSDFYRLADEPEAAR
jgi:hypothetical protein